MRWALLILLLSAPCWAQDEVLVPTGENNPSNVLADPNGGPGPSCLSGSNCSTVGCHSDVDEGVASNDNLENCTATDGATIRYTFNTPASNISRSANAQRADIVMTCLDADTDNSEDCTPSPTFSMEIYCNGSQPATPENVWSGTAVSATDTNLNQNFSVPTECLDDGSDLEFHFTLNEAGGGPNKRWTAIGSVEWEVTYASSGPPKQIIDNYDGPHWDAIWLHE